MKVISLLLVLGACLPALALIRDPQPPTGVSKPVPTFVVNLDDAPADRWTAIAQQYGPQVRAVFAYVINQVPPKMLPYIYKLMADVDNYIPEPYTDEMRGIAKVLEMDLGEVVIANLFYELTAACTSIVAQRSNGTVYHGRDLDYGIPGLQNITVNVQFITAGELLYETTTYVGYVGALTGMRPGAFSVSVDERDNGTIWENAFEALFEHGQSIGFLLRTALETQTTFEDALSVVSTEHLIASVYIIMAGVKANEGAVVTRERQAALDVWRIDSPNRWFLVETNYDHWLPPPADDDRLDPANQRMNQTTSAAIDGAYLFKVLDTFPNLNSETTYTTIMVPGTGYYSTVTQNNN